MDFTLIIQATEVFTPTIFLTKLKRTVPKLQEIGTCSDECANKCILVVLDGSVICLMQRYTLQTKKITSSFSNYTEHKCVSATGPSAVLATLTDNPSDQSNCDNDELCLP